MVFWKRLFTPNLFPPANDENEPNLSTDTRISFGGLSQLRPFYDSVILLALVHQHAVIAERGCTSSAQSSGIPVCLGYAITQKMSLVYTQIMALNNLAHPLCVAWSHLRYPGWILQSISLASAAPQRWQLWSSIKLSQGKSQCDLIL